MSHVQRHILASAMSLALIVVWSIHVFLFPMYTSSNDPPIMRRQARMLAYEQVLCRGRLNKYVRVPIEWKSRCPKFGIVSAVQGGRLGNQIWEYASVWATARRTGLEPFMPSCILKTLKEYFENLSIPPLSYIGRCTLDISLVVNSLSQWNSTQQNIIIPRHAAYWSLILLWLDDIRKEFTFKPTLRNYAELRLTSVTNKFNMSNPIFIGIHVRRTDYVDYLWQKLKVRPAPVKYYLSAMDYFSNKYPNTIFVVASDSIAWCKYNLRSNNHRLEFISEADARGVGKDLAVLAACNHSIIDYGTYGSFAALLAAGETIVYNVTSYFSTMIADSLPDWRIMS